MFTKETIALFWVNDSIFYSKSTKIIDDIILIFKDEFLLEREEDMTGFLCINITRDEQNNILTIAQTGLIEQILTAMDTEDYNHKYTPLDKDPLYKDVGGVPCCEK